MSRELKTAIYIIVDLLLLSILVTIISVFGGYSREALNLKTIENQNIIELTEFRNLSDYTKGRQITFSDIMALKYINLSGSAGSIDYDNVLTQISTASTDTLTSANLAVYLSHIYTDVSFTTFQSGVEQYKEDFKKGKIMNFPNGLLSGSDVLNFVYSYPQQYNVIIKNVDGTNLAVLPRQEDLDRKDKSGNIWYRNANVTSKGEKIYLSDAIGKEVFQNSGKGRHECTYYDLRYLVRWDLTFVSALLGEKNVNSFYYAVAVYDDITGEYNSVLFMRVGDMYA